MTWHERKKKIREQYYQDQTSLMEGEALTTPKPIGSAPSEAATGAGPSTPAESGASARRSSGTSATATASVEIPPDPLESSMPVSRTSDSSAPSTVWMVSPLGFSENNLRQSIVGPNGSLVAGLPSAVQSSLEALAIGRSEPIEDVVYQIAQWFVDAEDERAEGTLSDCLEFYVRNYIGVPA